MFLAVFCAIAMSQDLHKLVSKFEPAHKPKVLIVGFYHFANPGRDLVKADLDDHLSSKRQTEISALNAKLSEFKPTKIAIEESFQNTETQARYQSWLAGNHALTVNESEQVGFRLAKQFGHKMLFPIDTKLDMDFDAFMKTAGPDSLAELQQLTTEMQKFMSSFKDRPVGQNLKLLNSPESDRFTNGTYLRMLKALGKKDHPGGELVASWWKRNLFWISNLTTVAKSPEDRVLVICGAGHASLLRSILRDSIDFEVVDTMKYLP